MATIDELKKKDGSAVQLGAVRPAPVTGTGNTPALDPGGYLPGESVMGRVGRRASEAGSGLISGLRTVAQTMNLGAPGAATGMPFNSSAGAGRGAVPPGTPVGINQSPASLALAAPAATPGAAPTLPGATLPGQPPQTVATPAVAAMGTPVAAPTPAGALPAIPSGAIRRLGNSYSGGPNITGDISVNGGAPTGGIISAQNNQAAENLARRYGQASGFGPAGAIRGSGQVSSMDTSAGYAADLKQLGEIDKAKAEQNASMQAQADYAQENAMRVSGLGKAARELGALRLNNQTTRRDQDLQAADRGAIRKLAQDKLGLDTAKAGQDAKTATLDQKSKQQLMDAQQEYLNAGDDPAKLKAAERKLITLGGKQAQTDQFAYAPGGQVIDPTTGQLMTQPGVIFNKATGQTAQPQAQAKLPPGMTKQVGTANGKPVYEDASGKRYQ